MMLSAAPAEEESMVDKRDWPKPAAWAITHNESLWQGFDSVVDRIVVFEWSLGDNYRTHMMEPGDRTLFWITGANGGLARIGFVLKVRRTPKGYWVDRNRKRHQAPYHGLFFLPPLPNRRYVHRSAFLDKAAMANCELLGSAAQMQPPLRIERKEWRVIENLLIQFDRTNDNFRASWPE